MSVFELNEQVLALFNGEWHNATIHSIEAPGVYSVRWNRGNGGWMSEGYTDAELCSQKWRETLAETNTQHELNMALQQLYIRMEKGYTGEDSASSSDGQEGSEAGEDGLTAAQAILDRQAAHERRAKLDAEVQNNFSREPLPMDETVWVAAGKDGVDCYWTPDAAGEVAARRGYADMLVALEMCLVTGGEAKGLPWIRLSGDLWVPADRVLPFSERPSKDAAKKPEKKSKKAKRGKKAAKPANAAKAAKPPQPWAFEGRRGVVQLGRRVEARAIHNALLEDPVEAASPTMTALQAFLPRLDVRRHFRSIMEVFGLTYRSNDSRQGRAALNGCLLALWNDMLGDIRRTWEERPQRHSGEAAAVQDLADYGLTIRMLRTLTRNRFDVPTPELLQYVLATGRIRISKYLYAVGPPVNRAWTRALAKGLGAPLAKGKAEVMYDNVQALLKYGYRLPLESIISRWRRAKHIKFKWKHDNALRTFKIVAKRDGNVNNRRLVAAAGLAARRLPEGLTSIVLDYVNSFNYYENSVGE